ncbi:MAG: hypothetical protein ABF242_05445 [Flavobacteriales bacterium]
MKYIIFITAVVVLAFSCKKNDNFIAKEDRHEFCGTSSPVSYWFTGVISDTTSGSSLVGFILYSKSYHTENLNFSDTITDSTYLFHFNGYGTLDSIINEEKMQVYVKNASNLLVDSFTFPISVWDENDISTYNYSF